MFRAGKSLNFLFGSIKHKFAVSVEKKLRERINEQLEGPKGVHSKLERLIQGAGKSI